MSKQKASFHDYPMAAGEQLPGLTIQMLWCVRGGCASHIHTQYGRNRADHRQSISFWCVLPLAM
jgi:hypothetical protein